MKKSVVSLIALNHRSVLFVCTLLALGVFGLIAWRADARGRRNVAMPVNSEAAKSGETRSGNGLENSVFRGQIRREDEEQGEEDGEDLDESARDSPPDTTSYWRPAIEQDRIPLPEAPASVTATVVDVVVNNTNPALATSDTFGDSETNIAIDPQNPNNIVITAFSGGWGTNAPFWHSTDGGATWTKRGTFPPPPGVTATGCPCDQSVDYGRGGRMSGTVLLSSPTDVYSGVSTDPTSSAAFSYFLVSGVAKKTNGVAAGNTDQPWLLVNRDPVTASQDNVYVAYDDFTVSPRGMRVAVAAGSSPPNFTTDNLAGFGPTGTINPGHRLAVDPVSGAVYSLFQQLVQTNGDGSRKINFMLNRSTDGGATWTLNGSSTGIILTTTDSNQPTPKFGTVNALLGGVLHATVDPSNGDVYYVYGNRDSATGNNRLAIRRLTNNGTGGLTVGPEFFVTGQVQAALPSVAVNSAGVVGVFFMTYEGISAGFPQFKAHFATSSDHGQTFPTDTVLETFLSSAADNADTRQRVLGDYHQVKAVGSTFYGSFTGNGVPFGRSLSNHDPIFYKVTVTPPLRSRFDYDGDGKSDVSVFRPSTGVWYLNRSTAGVTGLAWGTSTDKITPADYDGDGKTDVAVFRPSEGRWYIFNSATSTFTSSLWGASTDIPTPGDFDGDGKADVAIFRPSDGNWWLNRSTAGSTTIPYGQNGDVPTVGDYDGDAKADIAVFRPSNGLWSIHKSTGGDTGFVFGISTDKVVSADYDGDGKTDIAVFRPSSGTWYIAYSATATFGAITFGAPTDIPAPGDYDGDGKADIAIFRPSDGNWWQNRSTGGTTVIPFGQTGDLPTENAFGN